MRAALICPACGREVNLPGPTSSAPQPCPACGKPIFAEVFPAAFHSPPIALGEPVLSPEEAACFYHAQKKAVTPCSQCGRFLCQLCAVDLNGQSYCLNCLETRRRQATDPLWVASRPLYGELAFQLALLSWVGCIVTAPLALYLALRYRHEPGSLILHRRWYVPAAIVLSVVQLLVFSGVLFYIIATQ